MPTKRTRRSRGLKHQPDAETIELLQQMFEGRLPKDFNGYDLNIRLHCKPWWPQLTEVWELRDEPDPEEGSGGGWVSCWGEAKELVLDLYERYGSEPRAKS